jgi:esterase/lipase superfamily enzyme
VAEANCPNGEADLVDVYYATTRVRLAQPSGERFFSADAGPLNYGIAKVSVPCRRERGKIERPNVLLFEKAKDGKHFILKSAASFESREGFLQSLDQRVDKSQRKELLLYIHGFNQSFADGAYRAAQLKMDLEIDGAAVAYSWPSADKLLSYDRDRRLVQKDEQVAALSRFLSDLDSAVDADRVYVVAHSMGNRLVTAALGKLPAPLRKPYDELILASADIEPGVFEPAWPAVRASARRVTLYASRNDRALWAAKSFTDGGRRIGDATKIYVTPGLETVDTSDSGGDGIAHDDFAGPALDDVRGAVWLNLGAANRCILETRSEAGSRYWAVPRPYASTGGGACSADDFIQAAALARRQGSAQGALDWLARQPLRVAPTIYRVLTAILPFGPR